MAGALHGLRVVELSNARGAAAGKLFADMGAEVIVVEPPSGDPMRSYEPFLNDEPGPERSLYWWHYNTSKLGVTLDLDDPKDASRFRKLIATADVLLECESPDRMETLRLDHEALSEHHPRLITVSITPFGRHRPRSEEEATDLTILAAGGPVWSCGYDDHSLPPVRGGGNQGYQTSCHFAVMSTLVALLSRDQSGRGQHIDVNMHAAANVTTEASSYEWLVMQGTVQRQTGRHAAQHPTMVSQVKCADGRHVNTGVPPVRGSEFGALLGWLDELGLREEFPEAIFLEMGLAIERIDFAKIAEDAELAAIFGAGREAVNLIASKLGAREFFVGAQRCGLAVGAVYSPEEVMEDPHFAARGFRVEVEHEDLGRSFSYPGAPWIFHATPWEIRRRAPHLGEHNAEILDPLEPGNQTSRR